MLEMKITNKIKVEWLFSIMPLFYNVNNFKTLYVNFDKQHNIKIIENNGYHFESLINKITNATTSHLIFDNVNKHIYPILYQYIKTIKHLLKN